MRGPKKFLLIILTLTMLLFAAGALCACGKERDTAEYTVGVTCEEEGILDKVEAALQTFEGSIAEGGERRPLTSGKAVFEVERGNYLAVLYGVPDGYTYLSVTVGEDAPTVSLHLSKKQTPQKPDTPGSDPEEVKIDEAFGGLWANAQHTLSVDTAAGKILLDGTEAAKIESTSAGGYTFTCNGRTYEIFFDGENRAQLCLKEGDAVDVLAFGPYVPPVALPEGFPEKWYRAYGSNPVLLFDGTAFTFEGSGGSVTAVKMQDGVWSLQGKLGERDITFLWTEAAFTLEMTIGDTPILLYAEGHVPFSLDAAFDGVWTGDGYEIVIDAEKGEAALDGVPAKELEICDGGFTFLWQKGETMTRYTITMSEVDGSDVLLLLEDEILLATLWNAEDIPPLPKELNTTFYDGLRSGTSISIDTIGRRATVDRGEDSPLSLTVGRYDAATGELRFLAGEVSYSFTFDRGAHALLPAEGTAGWAALTYYESGFLPLAEMPASLCGVFVERRDGNSGITFDGPHFGYRGAQADVYAVSFRENGGYTLQFDLEGTLGTLLWDPDEENFAGAKLLLCIGEERTELFLKEIVGYLDRGLSGSWLGDPVPGGSLEPIHLTLFPECTKVELKLAQNIAEVGHVTFCDEKSGAFAVTFENEKFNLIYEEDADAIKDDLSSEEGFTRRGPFIRYEADFGESTLLPAWCSFVYQDLRGRRLSFEGGRVILDGRYGRILHFDEAANSIFALAVDKDGNAGHVTYTFRADLGGIEAVALRNASLQGRFLKTDPDTARLFLPPRRKRYDF